MKTTGLTWKEAENRLRTGMTKFIEYYHSSYHNVMFLHKGRLCKQYHERAAIYDYPIRLESFQCVDKPTHTRVIKPPRGV